MNRTRKPLGAVILLAVVGLSVAVRRRAAAPAPAPAPVPADDLRDAVASLPLPSAPAAVLPRAAVRGGAAAVRAAALMAAPKTAASVAAPVAAAAPAASTPITQAQATPAPALAPMPRIAVAAAVHGSVSATSPAGETRALASGAPLRLGDRIATGSDGQLQVMLLDESVFALGPNGALTLQEFSFDPATDDGKLTVRIEQGSYRFSSGRIAHKVPERMKVIFPDSVLDVHGTEVMGVVVPGKATTAMLLGTSRPGDGERSAAFTLHNAAGSVDVNQPGFGTRTDGQQHAPPAPQVRVSQSEINSLVGRLASQGPAPQGQGTKGPASPAPQPTLSPAPGGSREGSIVSALQQGVNALVSVISGEHAKEKDWGIDSAAAARAAELARIKAGLEKGKADLASVESALQARDAVESDAAAKARSAADAADAKAADASSVADAASSEAGKAKKDAADAAALAPKLADQARSARDQADAAQTAADKAAKAARTAAGESDAAGAARAQAQQALRSALDALAKAQVDLTKTQSAADAAQKAADDAQQQASDAADNGDDNADDLQTAADDAQRAADAAAERVGPAEDAASRAQDAADNAQAAADRAKKDADDAQAAADGAAKDAKNAKSDAEAKKAKAQDLQAKADKAKADAKLAQDKADKLKADAALAKAKADKAQRDADAARGKAKDALADYVDDVAARGALDAATMAGLLKDISAWELIRKIETGTGYYAGSGDFKLTQCDGGKCVNPKGSFSFLLNVDFAARTIGGDCHGACAPSGASVKAAADNIGSIADSVKIPTSSYAKLGGPAFIQARSESGNLTADIALQDKGGIPAAQAQAAVIYNDGLSKGSGAATAPLIKR